MNDPFWQGRKVLVTGHTGFKGSWLCLWLSSLGADVTGYALPPGTAPNLFQLAGVGELCHSVIADIRDKGTLLRTIREAEPQIIIHMAAQPLVRRAYAHPAETYEVNTLGTAYLLDAVRQAKADGADIAAVLNVTTDKCYENREWLWGYREDDRLGGYDPYSSSKACSELVTDAFRRSYFPPARHGRHGVCVATARAGNVIGGGDWSDDRLVPDCMRALLSGSRMSVRRPSAVRPWQHVLEPLGGYMLLARSMVEQGEHAAKAWNFGPDEESVRDVRWIAATLGELWGEPDYCDMAEADGSDGLHEASRLKLDSSRARGELGWRPRWQARQALEKTADWYKAYQRQADMRRITLAQIDDYEGDFR